MVVQVAEQFLLEEAFYKKVKKQSGVLIPGPSSARRSDSLGLSIAAERII